MINSLYCQDLTKSALSTVSEGEPSSTLFAVLCIDILAFFSFQHCAKIIALIGAARSVVQFYCTMKRMRNCAKQVKKTVRIKTVYFFLRTMRSNFSNFLIQRINLISQIKSRMNASGEFLTFKRR